MSEFHSKDIEHLYDETYFLGGISKHTGQFIGVEGYQHFKQGLIQPKKIRCANTLDFKDKNVLDIGFGRGEILRYCDQNGAKSCIGIDYARAAVEIADSYLPIDINIYNLAFDEIGEIHETDIDIVYMMDVIEHIPMDELEKGFEQLVPKLSPTCELFASTPNKKCGDYLNMHNNYFLHEDKLSYLFSKYFNNVSISKRDDWFVVVCKGVK